MLLTVKPLTTPRRWAAYALGILLLPAAMAEIYGLLWLVNRYLFRL